MELPTRDAVPLPALVDDWVDEQCRLRSLVFADLAKEALAFHRREMASVVELELGADGTPLVSLEEEADLFGVAGVEDLVTQALCTLCAEETGAGLVAMMDSGWRRAPEPTRRPGPSTLEQAPFDPAAFQREQAEARQRGSAIGAAWRAAGRPDDPRKRWHRALARLTIPDDERFNVYVLPDLLGEGLPDAEARQLLGRLQRSREYGGRPAHAFVTWPERLEPMPESPEERQARAISWYRSLGVTVPHPDDDSPERRAWEAWLVERERLRSELGGGSRRASRA